MYSIVIDFLLQVMPYLIIVLGGGLMSVGLWYARQCSRQQEEKDQTKGRVWWSKYTEKAKL